MNYQDEYNKLYCREEFLEILRSNLVRELREWDNYSKYALKKSIQFLEDEIGNTRLKRIQLQVEQYDNENN